MRKIIYVKFFRLVIRFPFLWMPTIQETVSLYRKKKKKIFPKKGCVVKTHAHVLNDTIFYVKNNVGHNSCLF